jgi:hypothetical protein
MSPSPEYSDSHGIARGWRRGKFKLTRYPEYTPDSHVIKEGGGGGNSNVSGYN